MTALRKASRKRPELLDPDALFAVERTDQIENDFYAASWLWVAFLQDGDPAETERRFPMLLGRMADGEPAADALTAVYGRPPGGLAEAFAGYVKNFRTVRCAQR